jgi:predicted DNA-binding protein
MKKDKKRFTVMADTNERVTFLIPTEVREKLDQECLLTSRTRSAVIRNLVVKEFSPEVVSQEG